MMLNTEIPLLDVLLIEEWLAAVRPDAADWALEVGPHVEGDWGIGRADTSAVNEGRVGGEDRHVRSKRVACGWLAAEGAGKQEHDEAHR